MRGVGLQTSIKRITRGLEQVNEAMPNGSLWLLLHKHALQELEKELDLDKGSL